MLMMAETTRAAQGHRLQIEQLEDRLLLAGNVTLGILVSSGPTVDFSLTGDADSNSIAITTEGGELTVEGLDGTRLTPGAFNISPGILVELISATDFDGMSASFVTFNALFVDVLAGNTSAEANMHVSLGDGNDSVAVDGTTVGNDVVVALGDGNDALVMTDSHVGGDFAATAGAGNDAVVLEESPFYSDVQLNMGAGHDAVLLQNNDPFHGDLTVDMGSGNDQLAIDSNEFGDSFSQDIVFNMGSGDDYFVSGGNVFFNVGPVAIDGSAGYDIVVALDSAPLDVFVSANPVLTNWELIDETIL